MKRVIATLLSGLCLLTRAGCKQEQAKGPAGPPIVPVSVAKATQESVPTELRVVGTVEASAIVQMKSQIAGQLMRVGFTEGQHDAQGDLLFEIAPRPYDEALRQAEPMWRATVRRSPRWKLLSPVTQRKPNTT